MTKLIRGTDLPPHLQAEAKRRFAHRFTQEHKPAWANKPRPDGTAYMPSFADDADWLANTEFYVTNDGKRFSERHTYCVSHPTWPQGMKADD